MESNKELFERLVRDHKSTIYTVCYMFSKDDDEVADLFQETLINIWKGLPSFSGDEGVLRGWIYRVALNTDVVHACDHRFPPHCSGSVVVVGKATL